MADGATIDPLSLHCIVGGHRVSGFAPGSFLSVVYDVDAFTRLIGVDGEGAWFKSANRAALVTITLIQSSQSNDVLSGFHIADLNTPNGLLIPFSLREQNGTTLLVAPQARVIKLPDVTYSDSVESRAWSIGTTRLEGALGGVIPSLA